jgi:ABC-2 type transport system ATP-binding protein
VTVLFTTHLLDEAEEADRVAILSRGRLVKIGAPAELVREIGSQVLELTAADPATLERKIAARFGVKPVVLDRAVRIERDDAHRLVPELVEAFGGEIDRIAVSHPSLEDVYIRATGHRFFAEDGDRAAESER